MSISDALNYPFRGNNMLKILPIALAYGIVLFFVNYGTIEGNALVLCGGGIAALAFSLFIAGYYISALRRLQANDDNLPDVEVGQNIKDGFLTMIAGILYMLPVIIIAIVAVFLGGGMAALSSGSDSAATAGGGILLMCGAIIVAFVVGLLLSAALQVAIVRFAAENNSGALFDMGGNWSLAMGNFGTVVGLWVRTFVIGLISGIISFILGAILGVMFPEQSSPFFDPTLNFWLVSAIVNVAAYTISLLIGLAQYHLMYRFGVELGIGSKEKAKHESFEF